MVGFAAMDRSWRPRSRGRHGPWTGTLARGRPDRAGQAREAPFRSAFVVKCKDDYAANVRRLMPQGLSVMLKIVRLYWFISLDSNVNCGVNIFTLMSLRTLGANGAVEARQQAIKDRRSPRRAHAQSGARESPRSKVSGKRVLRSARRRTGQVRDAASCLHRQRLGDRGFRRVC